MSRSRSARPLRQWGPALAGFALALWSTASAAQPQAPGFDSSKAWEHLRQQVAIGPRPSGSPGNVKNRDYIKAQMAALGIKTAEQPFDGATPLGPVKMVNIIATIPGQRPDRIVLASHFDTKLFRDFRFVGASDGASSTAALLELARVIKARGQLPFTIELLFLDGEEAVVEWQGTDNTYGSRHYVDAGAEGRHAEVAARAHPARHDRRSQPDHPPRIELDALADRHRLGRGAGSSATARSWTRKRPSKTITFRS